VADDFLPLLDRELYRRYASTFKAATPAGRDEWEWWAHKYGPLLAGVDRAAPVLELGCGQGRLLEFLRRPGPGGGFSHVVGVDISTEQARLARSRSSRVVVGDARTLLEANPGRFGCIVAVDFLEHVARDELLPLVRAIHAALRPGGTLLVQTANGQGLFPNQVIYGDLTHLTIFTPGSLGQLLRAVGFDRLVFRETGPVPVRLRGRLDLALWSGIRGAAGLARRIETGKRQDIWTENFICRAVRLDASSTNQH
jgi:SAM-dependent methyltransferase